jgi:hypothetical protein
MSISRSFRLQSMFVTSLKRIGQQMNNRVIGETEAQAFRDPALRRHA